MDENKVNNEIKEQNFRHIHLKYIKFKDERQDILNKIYEIIGINDNNKSFYSHELDNDENKKKAIDDLIDEIKKYFKTYEWLCFKNGANVSRFQLSLIKYVFKSMNVNYKTTPSKYKLGKLHITTTLYTIE